MDKEHSLKGYLKRQSTEKLIQILAMYRDEKMLVEADDMTAWMEEILKIETKLWHWILLNKKGGT